VSLLGVLWNFKNGRAFFGFLIPWGCLKENEVVPIKKAVVKHEHRKTYA